MINFAFIALPMVFKSNLSYMSKTNILFFIIPPLFARFFRDYRSIRYNHKKTTFNNKHGWILNHKKPKTEKKSLKIQIKSQCYSYKVKEKKNSISDFFRKGKKYISKYKNVGSVRGMYDLF